MHVCGGLLGILATFPTRCMTIYEPTQKRPPNALPVRYSMRTEGKALHRLTPPRAPAMEHPTANINTLTAEVEALLADAVATDARTEALLAQPLVITSMAGQLAVLRRLSAENSAALDAIEAEQALIAAQLDELERNA